MSACKISSQNGNTVCNAKNIRVHESTCAQLEKQHEEYQYLNLIEKILKKGTKKTDRTGVGTLSVFGVQMRYSLQGSQKIQFMKTGHETGYMREK